MAPRPYGAVGVPVCQLVAAGLGWDLDAVGLAQFQTTAMRIEVRYQTPYGDQQWRSQWFATLTEAEKMVDFYRSCGSPAHIAPSSLAQFEYLPEYRRNHLQ